MKPLQLLHAAGPVDATPRGRGHWQVRGVDLRRFLPFQRADAGNRQRYRYRHRNRRGLSKAAGRPIVCSSFSDELLATNPFLGGLTALLDAGPLAGHADLEALQHLNPEMQSLQSWLAGSGHDKFQQALGTSGAWDYDPGALMIGT